MNERDLFPTSTSIVNCLFNDHHLLICWPHHPHLSRSLPSPSLPFFIYAMEELVVIIDF